MSCRGFLLPLRAALLHLSLIVVSAGMTFAAEEPQGEAAASSPANESPTAEEAASTELTTSAVVPERVRTAMQSRSFANAVAAIEAALADPDQTEKDHLQYLKGLALAETDDLDGAIEAFVELRKVYPNSRWLSRARFGHAQVLVKRRQYIDAGAIYREEATRLLSRDRKDELASIYLEFADRYYDGVPADDPSQEREPDFGQALTYYQEAIKLSPTPLVMQKLRFRIARCQQELAKHDEAIASYQKFLAEFAPPEPDSRTEATQANVAEARFRLGAVQLAAGQPATARRTWQDFLAEAETADSQPEEQVGQQLAKAEFRLAHTYGMPKPSSIGELELGVAAAQRFLGRHPQHELAAVAELEIAQAFTHHGRHLSATERLQRLIANPQYRDSTQLPIARRMLGQSHLAQQQFDEAIAAWDEFLDRHPTDPQWSAVQKRIVDAEYAKALYARNRKAYGDARAGWQTFLNKYPLDSRTPGILYLFGEMRNAEAVQEHLQRVKTTLEAGGSPQSITVSDKCEKLFLEAIADWRRVTQKYPQTREASQASFMIGVTLEDRLGRLADALAAYQGVVGPYESQAKQRIERLTAPQLEVMTERKFRSDESPRVKLTTRNLGEVTVKAYRIDMTDYFRKMHLARGIEKLDIALIDPDQSFVHEVKDYEQYRRINSDIEIPVDGVGVTAVTVASDKSEVTTMVVVSDLDVIVKSSRNEMFLFAENMRTGEPVAGASVLISDGSSVFAEEITNDDGVFRKSYDQLRSVEDLRVFAVSEGHVASTVNSLNGLDFAVGLVPRGYLFTDRPAYRAGQLVNVKGVVRWVDGDRFTFREGEQFLLDVYDARGRLLHSNEVKLNAFGSVNGNLLLPDSAPQGNYRVHLHRGSTGRDDATGALSFETQFQVTEYRLEPIQIVIDFEKDVYFRGETVSGTVDLKYYYGTPLAGETIEYRFGPDGELSKAKTDEEGRVEVSFGTRRYSESQPLKLQVRYPQRGIEASQTVHLATRGFAVRVDSPRDVYLSGETFDADLSVSDPAGNPVQTDLKVEVFRETRVDGRKGEKRIATYDVSTDPAKGKARQTIAVDDGGMVWVRATGTDRFGNEVSGQRRIRISGDKDAVRLRILAEKHDFLVGENANVRLHWRESPALALVTFEGASVLDYRLVSLKKGDNTIEVPMTAELAPNFFLSVAVMQRNKFHATSSGFRVQQRLRIAIKPQQREVRPGEDLNVELQVTDPQGEPLQAEVSLALVQANLLSRFDESQPPIGDFFSSGQRKSSVRQMTSCTFRYRPSTQAISQFLLAEAARRERRERESLMLGQHAGRSAFTIEGRSSGGAMVAPGVDFDISFDHNGDGVVEELFAELGDEQLGEVREALQQGELRGIPYGGMAAPQSPDASGFVQGSAPSPTPQGWAATPLFGGQQVEASGRNDRMGRRSGRNSWGASLGGRSRSINGQVPAQRRDIALYYQRLSESQRDETDDWIVPQSDANSQFPIAGTKGGNLQALTGTGKFLAIRAGDEAAIRKLSEGGAVRWMPSLRGSETAFWDPMIVTDAEGKASVVITMPERSTAWSLRAKGIDVTSLAGESREEVITRKELFGVMQLPPALTEGDKIRLPVEVHHSLDGERTIDVALNVTMGERSLSLAKRIEKAGAGIHRLSFEIDVVASEEATFELTTTCDNEETDRSVERSRVLPFGFPVYQTASGTSAQSTVAMVEFDPQIRVENPTLQLVIGPSVNRALLESVIGREILSLRRCALIPRSGLERNASDVLGGVALAKMIGKTRRADTPEAQGLASRIDAAVASIVSAQRDDGGWSWSGRADGGDADPYLSARLMWALAEARGSGHSVAAETFDKGAAYLKTAFGATPQSNLGRQTILLHAMSEARCADFALANRLYRERNRLSSGSLIHLALSLSAMDRKVMARDLLQLVKLDELDPAPDSRSLAGTKSEVPWMKDGVELRALLLLALQQASAGATEQAGLAETLLAARVGSRWPVEKSNGPAIAALANWNSGAGAHHEKYTLIVSVNDETLETLAIDPGRDSSRQVDVPAKVLAAGKRQVIHFELQGRGTFSYSAVLSGFVPAEQLPNTTDRWRVTRRYEPARRMLDGQEVPRGFGVVDGSYQSFFNPLTQLPVGQRGEVTLFPRRYGTTGRVEEQYDYLVLTEPIPAGCTVLSDSVRGSFERYEITPGQITFFIGAPRYPRDIHYTLVGYAPGKYRVAPSLLRSFYDPAKMAVADTKSLQVLPEDGSTQDEYRLTPDELFHLGKAALERRDFREAHQHLTTLLDDWRLDAKPYADAVQWLFRAAMEMNSHGEIVKYFEVIKEKYPQVQLSFEDILRVAASYRELAEYERSYLVYRSTVEASFERESQVAGFLNSQGEFVRSVAAMERLLRDYPAESYVAKASYSLAQEVYRRAPSAEQDARLKEQGLGRVHLIDASIQMLDAFLTTWPNDPADDQASFALATALIDLDRYGQAIDRCEEFAERYSDSRLLDSFWYMIGYSHFELQNHRQALAMCEKVASATFPVVETGGTRESDNKWEAVYIMGQVYHSLGEAAEAIAQYTQVRQRFADAAEAIEFFNRKEIGLDEVTTIRPDEKKSLRLDFRNVAEVSVKVYRIDLMKFGLMQRNLDRITAINLAGIKPYHEAQVRLGDGKDYRDREHELDLPLQDEGAYLVVCRGENRYASGLVLVSPLALSVAEDVTSGRVRVTVKDTSDDQFFNNVHVKVIGSANQQFRTGKTDLRGLFVADDVRGASTVIAEVDGDRYAFYRGQLPLQGVVPPSAETPPPAPSAAPNDAAQEAKPPVSGKAALRGNLFETNGGFQKKQQTEFDDLLNNSREGISSEEAY